MKILAVIPARSGSKSVPDKNIRVMNGKPMMAYSIEHALKSKYINRVIVSTDSEHYAEIARKYGAEVPFLRPAEYAGDLSTDFETFSNLLETLNQKEDYIPDIVVQLRPTYPIRQVNDIDCMIEMMMSDPQLDSVRTIAPAKEIPYKMWLRGENGEIHPLMTDIKECYNMPRQQLPKAYYQNACIDVIKTKVITEMKSMSGAKIAGYEMQENYDIDTVEEWNQAQNKLASLEKIEQIKKGEKTFVFDIDGVIAKLAPKNDYKISQPNTEMIDLINRLYEYGNKIVLLTARGYVTGIDWSDTTKKQLSQWGLKYHELHFGKPNADYYIDDKMISIEKLLSLKEELE